MLRWDAGFAVWWRCPCFPGGCVCQLPGSWAETQVRKVVLCPGGYHKRPHAVLATMREVAAPDTPPHSLAPPSASRPSSPPAPPTPFPPPPALGWSPDVCRALQNFALPMVTFINIDTFAEDVIMKTISRSKLRRKAARISYR